MLKPGQERERFPLPHLNGERWEIAHLPMLRQVVDVAVKINSVPLTTPYCKKVNDSPTVGRKPLRRTGFNRPLRFAVPEC